MTEQTGYITTHEKLDFLKQALRKIELAKLTNKTIIPMSEEEFDALTTARTIKLPVVNHSYPGEQEILQRSKRVLGKIINYFWMENAKNVLNGYNDLSSGAVAAALEIASDMIDCIVEGIPLDEKFSLKKLSNVRKQTKPFNQEE